LKRAGTHPRTASASSTSSAADVSGAEAGGRISAAGSLERLLTPVFAALAVVSAMAGGAIVVVIGASVAMRYFANAPFRFTEELVGLLVTASFFLALPLVTLKTRHVRVHLVVEHLPAALCGWAHMAASIFGTAFCIWFFVLCLPWFEFAFERSIKSEVARLLLYPWMALVPLSLALTALAFVVRGLAGESEPSP